MTFQNKSIVFSTSVNETSIGCYGTINWKTLDSFAFAVYILTTVLSLLSNSLVLAAIYKDPRLRTTTNYFICNMSASDVSVPIIPLLWHIIFVQHPEYLVNGNMASALCKITFVFYDVSAAVSVQSLVVIAIDRFFAIVLPYKKQLRNPTTCHCIICLIWVISIAVFSPYIYFMTSDGSSCYTTMTEDKVRGFIVFAFVILRVFPLVTLVSLYSMIVVKLRKQKQPGNIGHKQQERRRKRNLRITKILISAVFLFFCGWFVPMLLQIVAFFTAASCSLYTAMHVATVLPLIHASTGPFIYFAGCDSYRNGLRLLFSNFCRTGKSKKSEKNSRSTQIENRIELKAMITDA